MLEISRVKCSCISICNSLLLCGTIRISMVCLFSLQGNAGVGLTILTIILAVLIVLIVALSGIGVCERCHMESGGVYFLMSHVLGARIGGSVGVIYCFAQVWYYSFKVRPSLKNLCLLCSYLLISESVGR